MIHTCWSCHAVANHQPYSGDLTTCYRSSINRATWMCPFVCDACHAVSIAIITSHADISRDSYKFIDLNRIADIRWLPHGPLGKEFPDVPTPINEAASEAYACYHIGSYRAAALVARAVIEATAKDKGFTQGTLAQKIHDLEEKRFINRGLSEAATEIRLIGNVAAHGDLENNITEEDCDDLLDFMSSFLEEIYQRPANLARRKQQRERREAQGRA